MCGIAGFVNRDGRPADGGLLRAMTDAIAHRGPDGDGHYVAGPVALGHRRLAIIDLVTGAQPMGNEDGTVWITYNGEVYNFAALRTELEARGFAFRTTSDTEVILRAWEAFGPDCVERLRGMFAFAIWDARKSVLFLAGAAELPDLGLCAEPGHDLRIHSEAAPGLVPALFAAHRQAVGHPLLGSALCRGGRALGRRVDRRAARRARRRGALPHGRRRPGRRLPQRRDRLQQR